MEDADVDVLAICDADGTFVGVVEQSEIEWLTWRPALVVLAGLATYAGVAARRRLRPLLWERFAYVTGEA